jgi:F-type H+-transporting ATPase subunit epsilon
MHLEVVSAQQHVLTAEVTEIYARSVEGEIGILPGHQPALIGLDIGPVRVVAADGTRYSIAVHRGMLYVDKDHRAVVLADIAELSTDIDVERARARKRRLESELAQRPDDVALKVSLRKQDLRLEVAEAV